METSNLPALFWELVEQRLCPSDHYEARLLVGTDLIEQTYELKTEIVSFIALMKDRRVVNKSFQVSFPKFSTLSGIEPQLDKFIRFYQRENYLHNEKKRESKDRTSESTENASDIVAVVRSLLQEEVRALTEYLDRLQESLLTNFTQPSDPEGDCALDATRQNPVLVIEHGDSAELTKTSPKEGKKKLREPKTAGQINGNRTPEVSITSSRSTLSANSSASVSPRSLVEVRSRLTSPSSSSCGDSDAGATYRHRTKERLSASSRSLYQNGSPTLLTKKEGFSTRARGSPVNLDEKAGLSLPPLVHNTNAKANERTVNNVQKQSGFSPCSLNQGPNISSRFNSAQRFRQMVLQTRQHLAARKTSES